MAQAMHDRRNRGGRHGLDPSGTVEAGIDPTEEFAEQIDLHRAPYDAKVEEVTEELFGPEAERNRITAANARAFQAIATMAVTLLVVIFIVAQLEGSFEVENDSAFYDAYQNTVGLIGDSFLLMAITIIVAVAGLILYYVSGFGGGGGPNGGMGGGGRFR